MLLLLLLLATTAAATIRPARPPNRILPIYSAEGASCLLL